ncbi:MAG: Uma2 family endonuclease [Bryobacteraceae bacterium]
MATTARLTIDDFERLPQEQAKNHELVDGELIPVPGNTPEHIDIQDLLIEVLRPFVRERRLGKVYAELEYDFGGNAHAPDLSFFGPAKKALMNRRKRVQRFVPDLAIEIAPANDTFGALLRKVQRYRSCGTEEVWIVVPEALLVQVYSNRGDRILGEDALLTTELIPGFEIPVKRLFEELSD